MIIPDVKLSLSEALALARRYMRAVSDGRIAESEIDGMTEEELLAFDDELSELVDEAQSEAETDIKQT